MSADLSFRDGIPFGLPSMAEVHEAESARRRLIAERRRQEKPWPDQRPWRGLEELRQRWPNGERLVTAWRLAPDLDTCSDLLAGVPVSAERLDQVALAESWELSLVTLSAPIALLNVTEGSV